MHKKNQKVIIVFVFFVDHFGVVYMWVSRGKQEYFMVDLFVFTQRKPSEQTV